MLGKAHLPRTLITDIDGTILKHQGTLSAMAKKAEALPGTIEKLDEVMSGGHIIILVTGRPETIRDITEQQLRELGVVYHQLIMGVGHGPRILINDLSPANDNPTAVALSLKRDRGISDLDIVSGQVDK